MSETNYSQIAPIIEDLAKKSQKASYINPDINGRGVLVGITDISEVNATKRVGDAIIPCDGELYYRGYNVQDIVRNQSADNHFGFEEVIYLLLFGQLPTEKQFADFKKLLSDYRSLPPNFTRDVIMKKPSQDMMNTLARSVLTLYAYDANPDQTSPVNVLRQCLQLIANFPLLSVYGYQVYKHYYENGSLILHNPNPALSTAENILHCLRADSSFSPLEAKLLDVCLILHAEHGGGNNSTFTTHVVSAIAAALGSLKGPRHGGANIKVIQMFADMKKQVRDWTDEGEVKQYLSDLLDGKVFDKAGLIYGLGHAVYSISDPRAITFKGFVEKLSREKGYEKEYALYQLVARLAPEVIADRRKIYKGVSPNVDFYSGFAYQMLGLPVELYTPIFAIARIAGWSAHRMEEISSDSKIMRPAYMTVQPHRDFVPMEDREETSLQED